MDDDILRTLYRGEYFPEENSRPHSKTLKKEMDIMDKSHQKIMDALIEKYGEEMATQIDNDFMGSYASLNNEDMFHMFKEGFYLGFDIVMASINRED